LSTDLHELLLSYVLVAALRAPIPHGNHVENFEHLIRVSLELLISPDVVEDAHLWLRRVSDWLRLRVEVIPYSCGWINWDFEEGWQLLLILRSSSRTSGLTKSSLPDLRAKSLLTTISGLLEPCLLSLLLLTIS
jgi:hypothetical protein